MKTNRNLFEKRSVLLLITIAALTLSGPAIAGENVPFKGRSAGELATVGFDPVRGIIYTHLTGSGEATYLGRFTVTADVRIVLATGQPEGTWTLTAANGGMLFGTMAGGIPVGPNQSIATIIIVGGTGRFQGATGSYLENVTFVFPPPGPTFPPPPVLYSDVLEGTISFGLK